MIKPGQVVKYRHFKGFIYVQAVCEDINGRNYGAALYNGRMSDSVSFRDDEVEPATYEEAGVDHFKLHVQARLSCWIGGIEMVHEKIETFDTISRSVITELPYIGSLWRREMWDEFKITDLRIEWLALVTEEIEIADKKETADVC